MQADQGALPTRIRTVDPTRARIHDVVVLPRAVHRDSRGLLVETLRQDDRTVEGDHFAMSYTSVTVPGEMRDRDRWHVHQRQQDRFIVPLGEMILALYDARPKSRSVGTLDILRLAGPSPRAPGNPRKTDHATYLVTIPEGVYHCIGNLHSTDLFVLQNFPTRLYDAEDEGRILFHQAPIGSLGGRGFSWDLVEVVR